MGRIQLRLLDVMALVAFAAIIFAFKSFLDRTPLAASQVHEPAFAIYLAVLCVAGFGARVGRPRWRPFWSGLGAFGVVYLAIGMKMG